jgi:HSP20 family protein
VPQLHVSRTDEGYRVTADLPGFAEGDVKLDAHAGVLTLSGQRTTGNWEEHAAVRRERSSMRFATSVRLPEDANIDTVAGKLTDGVLTISISHKPEVKPRQIKIQAT